MTGASRYLPGAFQDRGRAAEYAASIPTVGSATKSPARIRAFADRAGGKFITHLSADLPAFRNRERNTTMAILNAYGDINQRTNATDDPAPDRLNDGTTKPAGWTIAAGGHYRGRTHERPRPTADDLSNPRQLVEQQRDWDAAEFGRRWKLQMDREWEEAQAAEKAERARQRKEADAKVAAAKRSRLLEPARRAYFAAGGDESGWEAAEAEIEARILADQAVAAVKNPGIAPLVSRHTL